MKYKHIIKKILDLFDIRNINIEYKYMGKPYAKFNGNTNILTIANNKKSLDNINVFIKIILHEIDHILMYKKHGNKKFNDMYKSEIKKNNHQKKYHHNDNKYEIQANAFAEKNFKKCISLFGNF